ncbi:zinc finger protein 287-like, partial [Scleropages formosus]
APETPSSSVRVRAMADSVKTFQSHLTSVLDSLVRASVCEITKLFQDTVKDYLVEISLNRKENEALKLRLRLTENKLRNERKYGMGWAAGRRAPGLLVSEESGRRKRKSDAGRTKHIGSTAFTKDWPTGPWQAGSATTGEAGGAPRDVYLVQLPGGEEEEEEEAVESTARESEETTNIKEECESEWASQITSAGGPEKLAEQQRTRHGVEELPSLETGLKAERGAESATQCLGQSGAEREPAQMEQGGMGTHMSQVAGVSTAESGGDPGDFVHLCNQCGYTFNSAGDLEEHPCLLSVQEQQHTCTLCGKSFNQASHLLSHVRLHTEEAGERPYRCAHTNSGGTMSENTMGFQSQLAALMEMLVKAVVCETTKLFESGVLQLRVEMANVRQENEELKARLRRSGEADRHSIAQRKISDPDTDESSNPAVQLTGSEAVDVVKMSPIVTLKEENSAVDLSLVKHE